MLILDATTKSLQIKLGAAPATNQLPFSASYVDSTGTTTTPGEQDGTSNGTTAATIVGAPAASTQRLVKSLAIQNADTAAATVTVIYNNNSTLRNIFVATLAVGDQLIYEDGDGWRCLDSNGNLKTSVASGSGYVASSVPSGSAVSLTNGVVANVTSITLGAGEWDLSATGYLEGGSTTNLTYYGLGISQTSATFDTTPGRYCELTGGGTVFSSINPTADVGPVRMSLTGPTTFYLVVFADFTVSTCSAFGIIAARSV